MTIIAAPNSVRLNRISILRRIHFGTRPKQETEISSEERKTGIMIKGLLLGGVIAMTFLMMGCFPKSQNLQTENDKDSNEKTPYDYATSEEWENTLSENAALLR